MSLPQPDPSLPGGAAPLFSDTDAARGDHMRANNQAIWENLEYLNDGENINDATAETPVDADRAGFFQIAGAVIKYVTFANLFLWISPKIAALASKTTPVDADSLVIVDSEASNVGKRLTFTNLKAFLKTYFDTLYVSASTPTAWTPTFTGFGTVSGVTAYSWRVGAELHFEIRFTNGTPTATEARISLGFNGTDGNVTSASNLPALQVCGVGAMTNNGGAFYALIEASKTYICIGEYLAGTYNSLVKRNGNECSLSGDVISFKGSVRIQGW
jgi:hypothetical protein